MEEVDEDVRCLHDGLRFGEKEVVGLLRVRKGRQSFLIMGTRLIYSYRPVNSNEVHTITHLFAVLRGIRYHMNIILL